MMDRSNQRGRGRYAARGGGQPPSTNAGQRPPTRSLVDGLVETPLQVVQRPAVPALWKEARITQVEYVASYNWTDSTKPTILVPGSAPEWRNKPVPFKVHVDKGLMFMDEHGFRMPSSPLYPLFRAADIMAEDRNGGPVDWPSVDFITDRNCLRKILRWASGSAEQFRIDMQLAGNRTVLMNRWERTTAQRIYGTYYHNFERASTVKARGCEAGASHYRVIKYDFEGLTMVVRAQVDAYLPVDATPGVPSTLNNRRSKRPVSNIDTAASTAELDVIRAGSEVPQGSLVEMITRITKKAQAYTWDEAYSQLLLSQDPHHILAVHENGEFHTITKRRINDAELVPIEATTRDKFRRLRAALEAVQELVVEHGQSMRLSLVCLAGQLAVYERISQDSCLPENMLARFVCMNGGVDDARDQEPGLEYQCQGFVRKLQ
ncbi:uncharacterized protein LAESUDRAFT_746903 [Laetiporus sulphureus 93-53]|uniref:Geranylgeranyl pyrophosphate synthetase n=1 Tax=Laetiporus sulphureus 93-53 TaxID=1314785 RepID=A0A165HW13_9APHY|nr:uncharacterized protein LAESUDRAFT_746903 [Laetiporus sulphureus 93-53]KZT12267.1 hypothetical protein LAESUDRAFT_746903 [Laetiporus sulphureus 93-53]